MDSGQLNSLLKRLCKILWEAQVTNPITYVTQLSYLLFLKMLEEMDAEQKEVGNGNHKTLFSEVTTGSWGKVDFEPLRWSRLTSNPDNTKMLATLRDYLPKLAEHPLLSQGARAIFHGATTDWIKDGTPDMRRQWHNLKYYTWVEQQGKTVEELDAQRDPQWWLDHQALVPEMDARIKEMR